MYFWKNTLLIFFFLLLQLEVWALCVDVKKANLRQGPSTKHEKLWQVFQYMPFEKIEEKGGWYKIKDVDGDIYWIHSHLTTEKYQCAVLRQDQVNIRKGPGTKYAQTPWSPMEKYYSVKVLQTQGKWVNFQDEEGNQAWVHRSLVWIP